MGITRTGYSRQVKHVFEFAVEGVEAIVKQHTKQQFQPDRMGVVIKDGKLDNCVVSGPRILKAGLSENTNLALHYSSWNMDTAPVWVRETLESCMKAAKES